MTQAPIRPAETSTPPMRARLMRTFIPLSFISTSVAGIVAVVCALRWGTAASIFALAVVAGICTLSFWAIGSSIGREIALHSRPKESEEYLRQLAAIVEFTEDAVISYDLDGRITSWNGGAEKLYGYKPEEIRGRDLWLLTAPKYADELKEKLEIVGHGTAVKHFQIDGIRKDGAQVPLIVTISPIRDEAGIVVGLSMIARDLTMRLEVEKELRRAHEELKGSLAELEIRNQWLDLLSQLTELLGSSQTPEEGYPLIGSFARQIFPSDSGALFILNPSRKLAESVVVWGGDLATELVFSPDDCWGLRLGKPHFIDGVDDAMLCRHFSQQPSAGYYCVPILAQGDVFALLYLETGQTEANAAEANTQITEVKQRLLAATFAERIGLSLANLRLREQLRSQSIRDSLTGLFNRSYLEETLEREVSRAKRRQAPVGVIMLDIDHFKEFNDQFGHDCGDVLLREVGCFLNAQSRKQDVACRYGGEEFTLILPDASLKDTAERAEQLRSHARTLQVKHGNLLLGPITFSLGVAGFPDHGDTPAALLKEADKALYRAKAEGRNRVVVIA